jgi:aerobic carbon-monoxide dehydrogenase medium subunit
MIKSFELLEPKTVKEACSMLSKHGEQAKVIAGGVSLLLFVREGLFKPKYLVDINRIKGLDYIKFDAKQGLKIGALTTHRSIENSKVVKEKYPVLAETVHRVGSTRIRNVGTLGGNLCHADPRLDPPPTLLALDAKVKVVGPKGTRSIRLEDFFTNYYETVLKRNELLTEVSVPKPPPRTGGAYVRFSTKTNDDTPAVELAAVVTVDRAKEVMEDVRIGLGALASTAIRARKAEAFLKGKKPESDILEEAGRIASGEIEPIGDLRGSEDYKREMLGVMLKRGIQAAFKRAAA